MRDDDRLAKTLAVAASGGDVHLLSPTSGWRFFLWHLKERKLSSAWVGGVSNGLQIFHQLPRRELLQVLVVSFILTKD